MRTKPVTLTKKRTRVEEEEEEEDVDQLSEFEVERSDADCSD